MCHQFDGGADGGVVSFSARRIVPACRHRANVLTEFEREWVLERRGEASDSEIARLYDVCVCVCRSVDVRWHGSQQAVGREELDASTAIKQIDFAMSDNCVWSVL